MMMTNVMAVMMNLKLDVFLLKKRRKMMVVNSDDDDVSEAGLPLILVSAPRA